MQNGNRPHQGEFGSASITRIQKQSLAYAFAELAVCVSENHGCRLDLRDKLFEPVCECIWFDDVLDDKFCFAKLDNLDVFEPAHWVIHVTAHCCDRRDLSKLE